METIPQIDFATIESWVKSFIWPFFRIAGMFMSMVVIGTRTVSRPKRLVLAVTLTLAVAPVLPAMPNVPLFGLESLLIAFSQTILGLAIGFVSRLVFETFVIGGQIIAMQSGLGFASLNDPVNGTSVPVLGQYYVMMVTLIFLSMDGHLIMFELIIMSFDSLPVSPTGIGLVGIREVIMFGRWMFGAGLMMALAAVVSLLMINLSFGVMTKAAPQLNIFAIGFPMTLTAGLIIVWLTSAGFVPHFEQQFLRGKQVMCNIVQLECGNG
jgi:flagellar biosynthesis protein FliR